MTKSKPSPWYENLDGTVENGVLCTGVDGDIFLAIHHDGTFLSSNNHMLYGVATPLTRAEIQRLMDNAPEEV